MAPCHNTLWCSVTKAHQCVLTEFVHSLLKQRVMHITERTLLRVHTENFIGHIFFFLQKIKYTFTTAHVTITSLVDKKYNSTFYLEKNFILTIKNLKTKYFYNCKNLHIYFLKFILYNSCI